ncbi:MAG: uracil phosphoribosyltransferase [Alphaproteobacteria bacterium]
MANPPPPLTLIDHPLVQHKLSLMRRRETSTTDFRQLLRETATLMAYEITRTLPLEPHDIVTPVAPTTAPMLAGEDLCLVSIMRAGDGLLQGMLDLIPKARVGHVGLYRDPVTLAAVEYYFKMPSDLDKRLVIVVDPMLATGNTAIAAVSRLKQAGAKSIKFLCLLTVPEGLSAFNDAHPDVPVFAAGYDEKLNEKGYIVPGIGDAGDRLFGTV